MPPPEQPTLRDAVIETACNRWQTAETQWLECAPRVPSLATFYLADISMRTGDIDRAMTNIALAEVLVPKSPYIQRLRERAATVLQRRGSNPDIGDGASLSQEDLRKAARIAVECHRWPRAVELWSLLLERSGANPEAYRRLGTSYSNLGDYGNSVLYFREANKQSNDAQLGEAIDRSSRLEQRRFDSFTKHTQRFMQHPAFEVAQAAAIAGSSLLAADLYTLSLVIKAPIEGSLAPMTKEPPTTQPLPAALHPRATDTRPGVVLREIDLSAFRPRSQPPPLPQSSTQGLASAHGPASTLGLASTQGVALQRPAPPPLPATTDQPSIALAPVEMVALHGRDALPRIRPPTQSAAPQSLMPQSSLQSAQTAPAPLQSPPNMARSVPAERPQIPPSSPTTQETGSLIARLRTVNSTA